MTGLNCLRAKLWVSLVIVASEIIRVQRKKCLTAAQYPKQLIAGSVSHWVSVSVPFWITRLGSHAPHVELVCALLPDTVAKGLHCYQSVCARDFGLSILPPPPSLFSSYVKHPTTSAGVHNFTIHSSLILHFLYLSGQQSDSFGALQQTEMRFGTWAW